MNPANLIQAVKDKLRAVTCRTASGKKTEGSSGASDGPENDRTTNNQQICTQSTWASGQTAAGSGRVSATSTAGDQGATVRTKGVAGCRAPWTSGGGLLLWGGKVLGRTGDRKGAPTGSANFHLLTGTGRWGGVTRWSLSKNLWFSESVFYFIIELEENSVCILNENTVEFLPTLGGKSF